MSPYAFGGALLVAGAAGVFALLAGRITAWTRVPASLVLLVVAAVASDLWPRLHHIDHKMVENIVTVALIYILFEGGLGLGWHRTREALAPIGVLGVFATFGTVALMAVVAHGIFGFTWFNALLLATAISPTDPAVVFSVLNGLTGKAMTVLAGESGANDPVGIALMAGLVSAGAVSASAFGHIAWDFVLQLVLGAAVGLVGGRALLWFAHRVPMESAALNALRMALGVLPVFGIAVVAHGSGFLAVFVAGILLGDPISADEPPDARSIHGFHVALANLGEITAFLVLGLSIRLHELAHLNVWVPGLILAAIVGFVVRPLVAGLCLTRSALTRNERAFVLFAGLKGAVPILLATTIYDAGGGVYDTADRLYGIVVVVVIFSVLVQGTLVPTVAKLLRLSSPGSATE
ncbi:MAG TPA: cation:proton antiporter [Jatrophihabitans sp.]